jgi:hypothetical protein
MVMRLRQVKWAGHIPRKVRREMRAKFWSGRLKGRDRLKDVGVDGKIILEWILRKYCGKIWTGCMRLRTGTSGGLL